MNGPTANGSGFSSAKLARHPFNLRYIYLRIVAALIRTLVVPIQTARILSAPQVDGVKETTIRIPSREKGEKGRWIAAKVFEPAQGLETTPAVHVNLHGSGFCELRCANGLEGVRRRWLVVVTARRSATLYGAKRVRETHAICYSCI